MDTNQKMKAEKLQAKLDKLLQTKEKRQQAFEKAKSELNAVSKEVDALKFKLFEILQSGSDDTTFSNWAKRKITENGDAPKTEKTGTAKNENDNPVNSEKPISVKTEIAEKPNPVTNEKPVPQSQTPQTGQIHLSQTVQNQHQQKRQTQPTR